MVRGTSKKENTETRRPWRYARERSWVGVGRGARGWGSIARGMAGQRDCGRAGRGSGRGAACGAARRAFAPRDHRSRRRGAECAGSGSGSRGDAGPCRGTPMPRPERAGRVASAAGALHGAIGPAACGSTTARALAPRASYASPRPPFPLPDSPPRSRPSCPRPPPFAHVRAGDAACEPQAVPGGALGTGGRRQTQVGHGVQG